MTDTSSVDPTPTLPAAVVTKLRELSWLLKVPATVDLIWDNLLSEEDAAIVRQIFSRYAELANVRLLAEELGEQGIRSLPLVTTRVVTYHATTPS